MTSNDPFLPLVFLQSGQSDKARFWKLADYKAAIGDYTISAISSRRGSRIYHLIRLKDKLTL